MSDSDGIDKSTGTSAFAFRDDRLTRPALPVYTAFEEPPYDERAAAFFTPSGWRRHLRWMRREQRRLGRAIRSTRRTDFSSRGVPEPKVWW